MGFGSVARRWLGVALVVGVLGAVGCPAGAMAEGSLAVGGSLRGSPLVVEGGLVGGEQEQGIVSPEMARLHGESEVAYEGQSSSESRALADSSFPGLIDEALGGPPSLGVGETFEGFPTDNAAAVVDEGRSTIVESLEPIAVQAGSGGRVPIDLSLQEAGGGFAPKTPAAMAHLRLPRHLGEGVALSDLGVGLTPVDEDGVPLQAEGAIDGATVFYGDSQDASVHDLSTVVKPITGGMDLVSILSSKVSPERLYFKVGLPEGASLEQEGKGPVQVVDAGQPIALISAPAGRDAEGKPVPLALSVSGNTVIVAVARAAGDYEYPVMVDPILVAKDEQFTGSGAPTNWRFCASDDLGCEGHSSAKFKSTGWGGAGGLTTEPVGGYEANKSVWLQYLTQGESKIYEAGGEASGSNPSGNIESVLQLANSEKVEGTQWLSLPPATTYSTGATHVCPEREPEVYACESGQGKEKNLARFEQSTTGAGSTFADTFSKATVHISQTKGSVASFNTNSTVSYSEGGKLVERENVLHAGSKGWLGPHSGTAFEVIGHDPGVGVSYLGIAIGPWALKREYLAEGKCAGVQCSPTVGEPVVWASAMPDGEDTVEAITADATSLGYGEGAQAKVRVDATSPVGLTVAGLPSGGVLDDTPYRLTAQATDGSGTTTSSGIKSLELGVDGYSLLGGKSGSCQPGPCMAGGEWTLHPEEFGAGKHKIELVAIDNAGNEEMRTYEVTIRHASPMAVGPGSVDPITGTLTLSASDVAIGGGFGALGVSRSYDSRELTAGAEGSLGGQWSLSLSGEQGIESEPTGDVTLVAEDGSRTTFTSDGKGGFVSPKGDESLVLSAEREGETVKAYLLKDPAKSTTVRFIHPAGAGAKTLWVIEKSEGAISKETGEKQTYKWEVLEGVERPKEALAPAPSGVSCEPEPKVLTELKVGCRALSFTYSTETKATGEAKSEWGEYKGRLSRVSFTAYNPATKAMVTTPVGEYAYDRLGRLRAEWDPRISPALMTTYGYDSEGHVVAVNAPGQEPWLLHYGTTPNDASTGRLLSVIRPAASTSLGSGPAPGDESKPVLSTTTPVIGTTLGVSSNGSWSGSPLAYTYLWQDCDSKGEHCAAIAGAVNETYTPQARDTGYTLEVSVTAINADGTGVAFTAPSGVVSLSVAKYSLKFGALGEGAAQLKAPAGVAIDASGNVWVADHSNNRLDKFSATGTFLQAVGWGVSNGEAKLQTCVTPCRAGIAGSGSGQFSSPDGLAVSGETILVADAGNSRIQELNTKGEFVRSFGSKGSEPGQLQTPVAVAVAPSGYVWVADRANNRIDEFTETGTSVGSFGVAGTGNGQFKEPSGIAFSGEYAYVVDAGNDRVQQLTSSGNYVGQFGAAGSGNGQFSGPAEIATEPVSGDLFVADSGNSRVQEFNPAGTFVASIGSSGVSEGQFKGVEGIAVTTTGSLYAADLGNNRVQKFTPAYSTSNPLPAPPSLGSSAVTTLDYGVPLTGTSAPYALGKEEVEKGWAQKDLPSEATAVYPPDEPMGWPAKDYTKATVWYFDPYGRTVNVASPSGGISTSEYNETNNVVRTLSAANRALALKEGTKSAEVSKLLDTQNTYNSEGTQLLSKLGPQHKVKLSSGEEKQARNHIHDYYDEGAPGGETYDLLTKSTDGAEYEGKEADVRTTIDSYSGQENLGWLLRKPTSVTTDPGGLELVQTDVYEPASGRILEAKSPAAVVAAAFALQFGSEGTGNGQLKGPQRIAVDSTGHLWVSESGNDRVQELSSTGEYIRQFGSEGTGNGQFKAPRGIAIDSAGHLWVVDRGNNRVQEFSATGEYMSQFGSEGTGNGRFKEPDGLAIDSAGHLWVTDSGNSRVQEFSATGEYIRQFGSIGTGNGQFLSPAGIAVDSTGHLWVTGVGDDHVQEFSSTGEFIRRFGSNGTANGQFKEPEGVAIDSAGHLWVTDKANNRVQEFSSTGEYMGQFGSVGGQLQGPTDVAIASGGDLWVTEKANNRVQEWVAHPLRASYSSKFGAEGTGNGRFKGPEGVAIDSAGHLWVTDISNSRVQEFSATGEYMSQFGSFGTGNGQFQFPAGIAVDSTGHLWVTDIGDDHVQELSSTGEYIRGFGSSGTANGQFKEPEGVAIDSGGHLWVTDKANNRVQEFSSTGEYIRQFGTVGTGNGQLKAPAGIAIDSAGHLWVADKANNRVQEFSSTGEYIRQFGTVGTGNGQLKAPAGVAIDSAGHLWVTDVGNHRVQEFSATGEYMSQVGSEGTGNGQFTSPRGVGIDSGGHLWVADKANNRVQKFLFVSKNAHESQTVYYSSAANAQVPECGGHPEWANLPCRSQPAIQPGEGAALPTVTDTYNMWDESETVTEEFGSTIRTKKSTYDNAGRLTGSEETSTLGTALPKVADEYSAETGVMLKQSTTSGEKTQTIASVYDKLGRLVEYTDADGNKSSYVYDIDGRVQEMSDGKGSQIYAYDPTTGALTKLLDSAAKTFTAGYDVAGRMTSETYPNGMTAKYVYDEAGEVTHIEYIKEAHCAGTCPEVWFSEGVTYSIHGEVLSRSNTLSSEAYTYDNAGRLTQVQETPAGKNCRTRVYAYDTDSNRVRLTTREPDSEGKCATSGGTTESHTYDEADRLNDTGVAYDAFGNTTALSAADAEGHEIKSTYYVSNQTHSTTQNGKTVTYNLDPDARSREIITEEGATKTTIIDHYSGPSSTVSWSSEGGEKYTRNIPGIDGTLTATEQNGLTPILQLHDLQGDIVATAALSETETKLMTTYNSTEFGVPVNGTPPTKYSWLGASGISAEFSSGTTASEGTGYVPQLGRPLQTQPITPPGANASGTWANGPYAGPSESWTGESGAAWGAESTTRQAARQQKAEEEAEEKAGIGCPIASMCVEPEEEGGEEVIEEEEEIGGPTAHIAVADEVEVECETRLRVDNPHKSKHKPGTVNVVAAFRCDAVMSDVVMRVGLFRNHNVVSESGYVSMGDIADAQENTAVGCRAGIYQGWLEATWVAPPGFYPSRVKRTLWGKAVIIKC